jgi:hypothetical protein
MARAGCAAPEIMAVSGRGSLAEAQICIEQIERDRWQTPQSSEAIGLAHPVPKAIQMK